MVHIIILSWRHSEGWTWNGINIFCTVTISFAKRACYLVPSILQVFKTDIGIMHLYRQHLWGLCRFFYRTKRRGLSSVRGPWSIVFADMPVSDSSMETRVMVAPTSSFKQGKVRYRPQYDWNWRGDGLWSLFVEVPLWKIRTEPPQANVVRLRHPRTRMPASFLHNPESGHLCELLAFGEEHRL